MWAHFYECFRNKVQVNTLALKRAHHVHAEVVTRQAEQIIPSFFDNKGVVYTNYVPTGATVNADNVI